ncbi:MAG: TIGR00730 family Rossman fold protein [Alphaproteobacteria bacterium]
MPRHMPDKAYRNTKFLDSRDGRVLRIIAEYLEPQKRLREAGIEDTIVFFGSARTLPREIAEDRLATLKSTKGAVAGEIKLAERAVEMSRYYEAAREMSYRLTKWAAALASSVGISGHRFSVVTGGGPGIMEAANRGAAEAGGRTIGMNISLPFEQYPNDYISDGLAFEFHYFFMRKFWLVYMAKAVIVMPGGFGTLDEFMEILTLVQTGKLRRKLPLLLFGSEYWRNIMQLEKMADYGTINFEDLTLFHVTDSVDEACDWLQSQLAEWAVDHPGAGLTDNVEHVGKLD